MESAAQALPRRSAPDAITGLVRISATPTLAETFLIPRLADLSRAHPGVDIELAAEIRSASLARREADLALRLADPEDGEVIARRMATLGFGLYANEDWRRRLAAGARPTFVTFDEANAHVPEAIWLAQRFPTARIALRLNSQAAQAAAAEAGFGVVLLPDFLGRSLPALAPVPIAEAPPSREVWLLSRPGADAVAAVRLVREALTEIFRRDAALLAPD
jgi:DNA-binding transcriptional LysR family regulator